MKDIIDKFYNGYEGEPEIQIIKRYNQEDVVLLRIWTGFFDNIMSVIEPEESGWTALAYYYNLYIGWYDESPWKVENIEECRKQLEEVDRSKLNEKDNEVLTEIIKIFRNATVCNYDILIAYE